MENVSKAFYAQVTNIVDCVQYQAGSVVSREILKKDTGTVTIFAFDPRQGLSEHTAPFDALVHVLEGQAEVVISGRSLSLSAGEVVIMPAHEPHSLKAAKRFKMVLTMIKS